MFLYILELGIENKKKIFRENSFENMVSEIPKKDYSPPKIRKAFMFLVVFSFCIFFLKVVLWTHQLFFDESETPFSELFSLKIFCWFYNLKSKMSRNMWKWHHKVRNGPILPP